MTDPDVLRGVLDEVRRRGYAISRSERMVGVAGLGLPAQRYRAADESRLAKRVIAAANAVAEAAGARGG